MGFSLSVVSSVSLCSLDQEMPASSRDLSIGCFVMMVSSNQDFYLNHCFRLLASRLFFLSHDLLVDSYDRSIDHFLFSLFSVVS